MRNKIKIAFFDIDGTLVNMETKVMTQETRDTLLALQKNGIKICLATGRGPSFILEFGIDFDAYITFNGSYCFDSGGVLFECPMTQEDVNTLISNAKAIHRPVSIATRNSYLASGFDTDLNDYFMISNHPLKIGNVEEIIAKEKVYQLMLGCRVKDYEILMRGVKNAKIAAWWNRAVDIIPQSGGKGTAVEAVLKAYEFTADEAIAFGDGDNDVDMIQTVGIGVAMGNASPKLKSIANYICAPVAEEGIRRYCIEQGLI